MCVFVDVLGSKTTITYLKSNIISTSCQPSTSPYSKVKKVLTGLCLLFMQRGHFIWNRWADGFVTNRLQQPRGGQDFRNS